METVLSLERSLDLKLTKIMPRGHVALGTQNLLEFIQILEASSGKLPLPPFASCLQPSTVSIVFQRLHLQACWAGPFLPACPPLTTQPQMSPP